MRVLLAACLALALLAGCGEDGEPESAGAEMREAPATSEPTTTTERAAAAQREPGGRTITLRDSPFGTMLFDARRRAIYVFENDRQNRSVCYGECARAWPPVLTRGAPRAGKGVRRSLLGTTRRRDGSRQVTYRGRPLYLYAHEDPGEVRCHNVDLNGGFWWVVGPDGRRRP